MSSTPQDPNQSYSQGWDPGQQAASGPQANPYGQSQPSGAWASQPYGQAGYQPQTPQYASWGQRALGWLTDYFAPGILFSVLGNVIFPPVRMDSGGQITGGTPQWWGFVTALLLYLALSAYSANTGQTWGRKMAKTQLVGEDGKPIGLGRTFLRYIAHFVDSIILFIGWLFPLWDAKRQTIADKLMKTYVIDVSATGPINVQN